jgi:hypothetical protein
VYAHPRLAFFDASSEHYDYYEGTWGKNGCAQDGDCLISGCSGSTCAAQVLEISDEAFCQERMATSWPAPQFSLCGCLADECRWYFENDYQRSCAGDQDCAGLGPPGGIPKRGGWTCVNGACQF